MTPASPPPRRAYRRLRVPPFYPVPTRTRRDGWTVERQADFLGMLAETGSVIGACEAVGMSRKSAYRLRALPGAESFAAAWDAALWLPARKVTAPERNIFCETLGRCDPAAEAARSGRRSPRCATIRDSGRGT